MTRPSAPQPLAPQPLPSKRPAAQRRFLHLWLPDLSIDRARHTQEVASQVRPFVLIAKVKGGLRLQALDKLARARGLHRGMTFADARALAPDLDAQTADPAADRRFLERLARSHRRYTPALALAAPDALDLDITGAAELFGGEASLAEEMLSRLQGLGVKGQVGVADTPGLAYALARFGAHASIPERIAPPGIRKPILAAMPVQALGSGLDIWTLEGLGLTHVGQLLDMPRAALVRRFGELLVQRLDEALGLRDSPLLMHLHRPPILDEMRTAEPVETLEGVLCIINDLSHKLAKQLAVHGLGGRRFGLELFRVDNVVKRLEVAASCPMRSPDRITSLFMDRLSGLNEGLEADFGFDLLRLWAVETQAWTPEALSLLDRANPSQAFSGLMDRLAARDGVQVKRFLPTDSHDPQAPGTTPFVDATLDDGPIWESERPPRFKDAPLRPLRLFAPPQLIDEVMAQVPEGPPARFLWRRVWRRVSRAEGPERIEPPSGSADPLERPCDYYRLEDEVGRRYWVFRQGLYGQADPPRWFLHGLFG